MAIGSHAASAMAAPQPARGYPPTVCPSVAVSTTQPVAGGTFTISGSNFVPNAGVRLELMPAGTVLATPQTDGTGSFSTNVAVPAGVTGHHEVVATTGVPPSAGCTPSAAIDIPAFGGTTVSHSPPAVTGVQILGLLLGAMVLVGAGAAFTVAGRRRRAQVAKP
jgi:hypothetical protein